MPFHRTYSFCSALYSKCFIKVRSKETEGKRIRCKDTKKIQTWIYFVLRRAYVGLQVAEVRVELTG